MLRGIFRTKNLDDILAASQTEGHQLKRTLGPINITLLGIGAIIGAGIFATVGTAAAGDMSRPGAGPSLMVSFGITAIVCAFTALCYAEMAAMVPGSPTRLSSWNATVARAWANALAANGPGRDMTAIPTAANRDEKAHV